MRRFAESILRGGFEDEGPVRNGKRWWLALFYVLATVLAQGVHDHGEADDGSLVQHEPGCADECPHVAGHASPDLSHAFDHCPGCQYRAQQHDRGPAPPSLERPIATASVVLPHVVSRPRTTRLVSSRGPPIA